MDFSDIKCLSNDSRISPNRHRQSARRSLVALRGRWGEALPLVWLFNVVGTVDLFHAVFRGLSVGA
jgi:hypothetical protein